MGEDDLDLKNFDPKAYWADDNNETNTRAKPTRNQLLFLNKMIRYLETEKTMKDLCRHFKKTQGEMVHYFSILKTMRGVSLERRFLKMAFAYSVKDFRKTTSD